MIVKVNQLKLASEDTDMIELPTPSTDRKWMKEATEYLTKNNWEIV